MHETSLVRDLIERLRKELEEREGVEVIEAVKLKVGEMSCVSRQPLRLAFESLTEETEFESTDLELETEPVKVECEACGNVSEIEPGLLNCPSCENRRTRVVQGDKLFLDSIRCR